MSETPTPGYSERSAVNADATWAAGAAIEALQNGRYELGAGLAAIAARAQRAARQMPLPATDGPTPHVNVPLIGQTRDEQPARLYDDLEQTGRLQVVRAEDLGPVDVELGDRIRADAEQVLHEQLAGRSPETARCRHTATIPGDFCWKAIYRDPDSAVWVHVNALYDQEHTATPTPAGERA